MRPRVVICGSFHRSLQTLHRLFRELETTGCRVLSPSSIEFDTSDTFVKSPSEADMPANAIQSFHLRAIKEADFIMLHAPGGYIGVSAAFELGCAEALDKAVFCMEELSDEMLSSRVVRVQSVFDALERLTFS